MNNDGFESAILENATILVVQPLLQTSKHEVDLVQYEKTSNEGSLVLPMRSYEIFEESVFCQTQ